MGSFKSRHILQCNWNTFPVNFPGVRKIFCNTMSFSEFFSSSFFSSYYLHLHCMPEFVCLVFFCSIHFSYKCWKYFIFQQNHTHERWCVCACRVMATLCTLDLIFFCISTTRNAYYIYKWNESAININVWSECLLRHVNSNEITFFPLSLHIVWVHFFGMWVYPPLFYITSGNVHSNGRLWQ